MNNPNWSPSPRAHPHVVFFPDGIRIIVTGLDALRRARHIRRQLIKLGARMRRDSDRRKVLIETRAGVVIPFGLGVHDWQRKIPSVVEILEQENWPDTRGAVRLTYLEAACDVLGLSARVAAQLVLPRIVLEGCGRQLVKTYKNTTYLRHRRASRNVAIYYDRPHKLDPDGQEGPPVLHMDLRLAGPWLRRAALSEPRSLLQLLSGDKLARLWDQHVLLADIEDENELAAYMGERHGRAAILRAHDDFHVGPWTVPATAQALAVMFLQGGRGDPFRLSPYKERTTGKTDHSSSTYPYWTSPLHCLGMSIPALIETACGSFQETEAD